MPAAALYDDPDDPNLDRLARRFAWFAAVLEVDYGERDAEQDVPADLNWLAEFPVDIRYSFDEVECSLGFEDGAAGYACTIWDVSGEDDLPWAVYVVDDFGARLLPEYSTLSQDAEPSALDAALQRATDELPPRLLAGEFTRTEGTPLDIPPHLRERLDPMEQPRGGSDDDLLR